MKHTHLVGFRTHGAYNPSRSKKNRFNQATRMTLSSFDPQINMDKPCLIVGLSLQCLAELTMVKEFEF
jgi:hypothetical protein